MVMFFLVMLNENKNFLAFLAHISHIPYFYRIYFKTFSLTGNRVWVD